MNQRRDAKTQSRATRGTEFDLARFGEDSACQFLKRNGCKVIDRNYRAPEGEIDVVARKGNILIFAEVKARMSSFYAEPWEAVGFRKRRSLRLAARRYLKEKSLRDVEIRFDVLSILVDDALKPKIEWIQNAF